MAIKIITDSTSDIPESLKNMEGVIVVPLTVHFGNESYVDGVDITNEEFYEKLQHSHHTPTSSQVSANTFKKIFGEIKEQGDSAVGIFLSGDLSGTVSSASHAKDELGCENIYIIDSRKVTLGLAVMVQYAIKLRDQGKSAEEIYEELERTKDDIRMYVKLDTLKYLKKGGRLSTTGAVLGTVLNVKPVVSVIDGKVVMMQKVRGNAKCIQWIKKQALSEGIDYDKPISMGYSYDKSLLENMEKEFGESLNFKEYVPTSIGATVGTHGGPNIMALAFYKKR